MHDMMKSSCPPQLPLSTFSGLLDELVEAIDSFSPMSLYKTQIKESIRRKLETRLDFALCLHSSAVEGGGVLRDVGKRIRRNKAN